MRAAGMGAFGAFLFDLDGTLGDTLPLCVAAFRDAVEPLVGRRLDDAEIIGTFGPSEEGTVMSLVPDRYAEGMARYLEGYRRLHEGWPEPFPGIREILAGLRASGAFVGLVTGKGAGSTAITLDRFGLADSFDAVRTGSPEGPVKAARIAEIVGACGLVRGRVLYVGDSPGDITAARDAGVGVAAAAWAPGADADGLAAMSPDFLFRSVREMAEAFGLRATWRGWGRSATGPPGRSTIRRRRG